MKRPTEKERFEKWERSLNQQLTKAPESYCAWGLKQGKQLDLAKLTKWPVHLP